MICRKCGAEIPDNALRCEHCGIKVNMYCPECNTLNPFGAKNCKKCGFELIKTCPECNASNLYSANECRKCHYSFDIINVVEEDAQVKEDLSIVRPFTSSDCPVDMISSTSITAEPENTDVNVEDIEKIFNVEENIKVEKPKEEKKEIDEILSEDIEVEPLEEIEDLKLDEAEITPQEKHCEGNLNKETDAEEEIEDESEYEIQADIQIQAVEQIINIVKTSLTKHIIAINGPDGCGKSAVLKQVNDNLSRRGFVCLYGSCTPLLQITSFGFFQDAFLRMMGFPPYTNSTEAFIKEFKKSQFSGFFNFLNPSELNDFLNLFYPAQKDNFNNILENKNKMFSILEKVIKSFLVNNNLLIEIDNFELLDGASYDFIMYMLNKGYFNNRLKLLISYKENKSIQSYFELTSSNENIFETILIKKFTREELLKTSKSSLNIEIEKVLPEDCVNNIVEKSNGNAIRFEQETAFLTDTGYISRQEGGTFLREDKKPDITPVSFEELIKLRLNALKPAEKNVLFLAAIMGFRFAASILCLAVTMPVNKAEQIINSLINDKYIVQVDNYTCEFKSLELWKLIYQEAKSDLLYKENSERLYISLKSLILSSNLQKLISCSEALTKNELFVIWQETAGFSAKLGDTNLYVIAQKQCLKLLDEIEIENSDDLKAQIYEETGKLLCEKSPNEAITYLANVLDADIKSKNLSKIIDLSGYFVKSCYLTGNYFGAVEAVDAVVNALSNIQSDASETDIALIKTRKLKALLNIGNSEQIINLVNEEIVIELERGLNLKQLDSHYKTLLLDSWMLSKLILARAYCIQGNSQAENVVEEMKEFIAKYNHRNDYYLAQITITEAFTKTVMGDILKSGEILTSIANSYNDKTMDVEVLAQWNLVNIINRVLLGQNKDLKVDLFEFAAFANNINEYFIKNIIKLILGYVLRKEGNNVKALEIFNEQITYFAKEKVAIGALLAWALIVDISIEMGDDEKAFSTASKSLEIAQSSKINNNFFIILFQKYLAEIYIRKEDFTAAKMYLEKSLMLAKQFNLKYQLILLYVSYAKYLEELMKYKHIYSSENINMTIDMYNNAVNMSKELHLSNLIEYTTRERSSFKTFCQLHSIEI